MSGFQNQAQLKSLTSLTTKSNMAMLMRTLYRMGLNYCVLPPTGEFAFTVVFTKEQLVSLIERSGSEEFISEIPKRVVQGLFKPMALFKPDSSSSDFISNGGFAEPEQLQVLAIEEEGAKVLSLKEALAPRVPDFPEWWEAPVPFAMYGYGKLHVNHTAMLMFGAGLKRLSVSDIPDKNEFLVTLEGEQSRCSVTFRRLDGDLFVLEDSTSDIAAAEDVAWWAAIGKAWAAVLDQENRSYRRCGEEEAESLRSENTVLPCEWGGELLGYFCVENKAGAASADNNAENNKAVKNNSSSNSKAVRTRGSAPDSGKAPGSSKAVQDKNSPTRKLSRKSAAKKPDPNGGENSALSILGPQTMGLLAPGTPFAPESGEELENKPVTKKPRGHERANA